MVGGLIVSVAVFQQCVNAVADRVTLAFPTRAVYNRRKPVLLEADRVPCIVVSPAKEGESVVMETFKNTGGNVVYAYPIDTMLVSPGNEITTLRYPAEPDEEADHETFDHMEARETLRGALWKLTLDDVDSVFNGSVTMGEPFKMAGAGQSLYLVSFIRVTHWSLETQDW